MPENTTTCRCWQDRNDRLKELHGLRISHKCEMLTLETNKMQHSYCLPLEKQDGARLKRTDPKYITISHCPFCGKAFNPSNKS